MGWLKKTFKKINKTFDKFMPESVKKGVDKLLPESVKPALAQFGTIGGSLFGPIGLAVGTGLASVSDDNLEKKAKKEEQRLGELQAEQTNITNNYERKLKKLQNSSGMFGGGSSKYNSFQPFKTLLGK